MRVLAFVQKEYGRTLDKSLLPLIDTMVKVAHNSKNNFMKEKMDLLTAKRKAVELSKKQPEKQVFVIVDEEGECGISYNPNIPGCTAMHAYKRGSEVALPPSTPEVNVTPKTKRQMEKKAKVNAKASAKPAAKKPATKKAADRPAKTNCSGKKLSAKVSDMIKGMAKDQSYFVKRDGNRYVKITKGYLENMKDKSRVMEVYQ